MPQQEKSDHELLSPQHALTINRVSNGKNYPIICHKVSLDVFKIAYIVPSLLLPLPINMAPYKNKIKKQLVAYREHPTLYAPQTPVT